MPSMDTTVAALLVVITLVIALGFGWRQFWQVRNFKSATLSEEQQFTHRVARRRLFVSALLALVGIVIATLYLSGLEQSVKKIGDLREAQPTQLLDPAQRQTVKLYTWAWIAILLMLLCIVVTVGIDLWDVRRHWRQSLKQIREERRDMIDEQLAKLRAEHRNAQLDPERN